MTAYHVTDIANFFINYYKNSVDPMTLSRVQLFTYFAQAESLARNDRLLFEDEIRAYSTGPAVTRLYVYYEGAGNMPIDIYKTFDPSIFDEKDLDVLQDVAIYYNQFSTSELMIKSFITGGPWEQYYTKDSTNMPAIDPSSIKEFYAARPRVPNYIDFMVHMLEDNGMTNDRYNIGSVAGATKPYIDKVMSGSWE